MGARRMRGAKEGGEEESGRVSTVDRGWNKDWLGTNGYSSLITWRCASTYVGILVSISRRFFSHIFRMSFFPASLGPGRSTGPSYLRPTRAEFALWKCCRENKGLSCLSGGMSDGLLQDAMRQFRVRLDR